MLGVVMPGPPVRTGLPESFPREVLKVIEFLWEARVKVDLAL